MDRYVNAFVKHRAEGSALVCSQDHHCPRKLVDFLVDQDEVKSFGIYTDQNDGTVWGVPSLVAVVGHVVGCCKKLDDRLRDEPEFREALEARYSEVLEPQAV